MAGVIIRSLELMPLMPPLMTLAAQVVALKKGPEDLEPFERFLSEDMGFSGMSEELVRDDFALPNSHTLVALWSAIETCLEDTIVLTLMNDERAATSISAEVSIPSYDEGLLDERQARATFRRLESKARQSHGVMESADWMLGLIEMAREPSSDASEVMSEVNALRNSIMHNGGVLDQRSLKAAPSLRFVVGEEIKIKRDELRSYNDSLSTFVQELLSGVLASRYMRSKEELQQS